MSMVEAILRFVRYALLVSSGILLANVLKPFLSSAGPRAPLALASVAPAADGAASGARYDAIAARNLFGAAAPVVSAPVVETVVNTALSVKLLGVVAPVAALIQDETGKRRVVEPRDRVAGAEVARIEPRRLVLLNRGRLEAVELQRRESLRSAALRQKGQKSYARVTRTDDSHGMPEQPVGAAAAFATLAAQARANAPAPDPAPAVAIPVPAAPAETPAAAVSPRTSGVASIGQAWRNATAKGSAAPVQTTSVIAPAAERAGEPIPTFRAFAQTERKTPDSGYSARVPRPSNARPGGAYSATAGQSWLAELERRVSLQPGERIVEVNAIPMRDVAQRADLRARLREAGSAKVRVAGSLEEPREIEVKLP